MESLIIPAIVFILTVFGWIHNARQDQANKQQRQQRNDDGRPKRSLQDEIENFLQDIQQQKDPQDKRRNPRVDQARVEREPVQNRQRTSGETRTPSRQPEDHPRKPRKTLEDRRQEARQKEQERKQKQQKYKPPVSPAVSQSKPIAIGKKQLSQKEAQTTSRSTDLPSAYEQELAENFNSDQLALLKKLARKHRVSPAGAHSVADQGNVIDMIRSPGTIRNAIVFNEILQPPVSRR